MLHVQDPINPPSTFAQHILWLNDSQCHLTFHSCLPPSRNNTVLIPAFNNSSVTVCWQTAAGAGDLFWSRRAALAAAEWKCQQGFLFCHIRLWGSTHRRYHQLLWIPTQSFKIAAFHSHQGVGKKTLKTDTLFLHKVLNLDCKKESSDLPAVVLFLLVIRQLWNSWHCDSRCYTDLHLCCTQWHTRPDTHN